ncbi:hypothetical protein B296_00001756 [Ensete ventricosum]|uniref:Protein kinase domain-containing protein n=1 Tax=Ensete ventricosum TaxID=4639 RepID=A0A427A3A9_ENSVE|nr:hypothetical protein B296_00001756 [Ensete ventricosum]
MLYKTPPAIPALPGRFFPHVQVQGRHSRLRSHAAVEDSIVLRHRYRLQQRASPHPFISFPSSASKVPSSSSDCSLASLRKSLPEAPVFYTFPELYSATGNFHPDRLPGAKAGWRCCLRGKDVVVFQHRFRGPDQTNLPARLAESHHSSLVRLLGASLAGDHVYLVHEYTPGASLLDCLRNPRNPKFTPLSTWISRMQIASDIAHGLEYIHLHSSVHNRLKSSSVIVTEPGFQARICHFGAADLAGETSEEDGDADSIRSLLISGEEPLKYGYGSGGGSDHVRVSQRVSLIDTARKVIGGRKEGDRQGDVRRWVDPRLRDSYPVEAAEALLRLALQCVEEAAARPDMTWVAGRVSKLYLDSEAWAEAVEPATEMSVSIGPR